MWFLSNWKELGIFGLTIVIFIFGFHYKTLVDKAKEEQIAHAEIAAASAKLLTDNKIDMQYNRDVAVIELTPNIKDSHEKDAHCIIPAEWLRLLTNASR